jgi:hypothetical protein
VFCKQSSFASFFFLLLYFLSGMYLLSSLVRGMIATLPPMQRKYSNSRKEGNGGACREGEATWPENSS